MMNVSSWSIKNPIPAVMLFVMLTFAGVLSFKSMKVQNFPDLELPTVTVSASLPGAAPAQLETEVARKIENAIAPLQGLKNIYTKVQDGGVTITAEFRLEKPTQEAVDDVRSAVQGVRSDGGVEGRVLLDHLRSGHAAVERLYDERDFGRALREIMLLADRVNEYVDQNKPWELALRAAGQQLGWGFQLQSPAVVAALAALLSSEM